MLLWKLTDNSKSRPSFSTVSRFLFLHITNSPSHSHFLKQHKRWLSLCQFCSECHIPCNPAELKNYSRNTYFFQSTLSLGWPEISPNAQMMTTAAKYFQRHNHKVSELHSSRRGLFSLFVFHPTLDFFKQNCCNSSHLTDTRLQVQLKIQIPFTTLQKL